MKESRALRWTLSLQRHLAGGVRQMALEDVGCIVHHWSGLGVLGRGGEVWGLAGHV